MSTEIEGKDIDDMLDDIPKDAEPDEAPEPPYEFELWLSTDGKHSVHVKADSAEGKRKALIVATETYDYIISRYGTKQAQAVKEYSKNGDNKEVNPETCPHTTTKFTQSHTDKNPGRWFKSCVECKKFLGWQS